MDYLVRPADLDRDRDAVVSVWARNLQSHDESTHRAKFDWYYLRNPLGRGRCWVLETQADGQIVGTAGLGLRRLCVGGGRDALAGLASDFAVDPAHRSLRPALMLARAVVASLQDGIDFIYGMPNSHSAPVFRRVGYNLDSHLQRYVKVLRVEKFLGRRLRVAALRRVLAGVVNPGVQIFSKETWRRRESARFEAVSSFDDRFDDLWRRASTGSGTLMERTSRFLNWRYGQCPFKRYTILALTPPDGRTVMGYAVCDLRPDNQVALIDLFGEPDDAVREELLARVIHWARAKGAASISCEFSGVHCLRQILDGYGFRFRGPRAAIAVHPGAGGPNLEQLRDWWFLLADEDYN